MTRHSIYRLLLLVLMLTCVKSFAQVVEVEISIIPKVKVTMLSETNISDNYNKNNMVQKASHSAILKWFEISSIENIKVLIDLAPGSSGKSSSFVYVINTGYFDKSKARPLNPANMSFLLNVSDKTWSQNSQTRFKAWLGILQNGLNELQIVYN